MQENQSSAPLCKSVFKSGKNTTTEKEFTQKWITLINTLEKDKSVNFAKTPRPISKTPEI